MSRRPLPFTGTVELTRPPSFSTTCATYLLAVADGPDRGTRFVLDGTAPSRVLVGTSPSCEARLTDPRVSRRHVALDQVGQRLRLTDLGSTNGTFVNGLQVTEVFLDGGEFVRVGSTTLHVQQTAERKTNELSGRESFGLTLGASGEMRRLYPLCERLAESDVPVIIEGETGTGKEVLAESLHMEGQRSRGPFIVFDCTSTPPSLLESTLFGHERGAFTGADTVRAGLFEQAQGGTLLIDEIGELELSLQPKLLRVIQRTEVVRVGGSRPIKVDVRVMAATRRDLDREVQALRFRDDLFYRLNVGRIELPPLRRREGDISLLARHFWATGGGADRPMPQHLLQRFEDYSWPGNVRELRNAVLRFLALGDLGGTGLPATSALAAERSVAVPDADGQEQQEDADDPIDEIVARLLPLAEARQLVIREFERRYLRHVLEVHGGNVTRAAATAGVARRYLDLLRARHVKGDD